MFVDVRSTTPMSGLEVLGYWWIGGGGEGLVTGHGGHHESISLINC